MKALELSYYIIDYYNQRGIDINNLKLQKLLYYIQGYMFKKFNKEAFEDEIISWPYGPVVLDVYFNYNVFGPDPLNMADIKTSVILDKKLNIVVNKVLEKTLSLGATRLVNMTLKESPWIYNEPTTIIPNNEIKDYFRNNNPLEITWKN